MKIFKRIIISSILIVAVAAATVFGSFLIARRTMMQLQETGEICIGSELVLWKSDCHCGNPRHYTSRRPCWLFRMVNAKGSSKNYISFLGNHKSSSFSTAPPRLSLDWIAEGNCSDGYLDSKEYMNLARSYLEKHPINGVELNQYNFDRDNLELLQNGLYPTALIPSGKRLTHKERDLVSVEVWQKEEHWQALTNEYSASELSVLMTKSGHVLDTAKIDWLRQKHVSKEKNK